MAVTLDEYELPVCVADNTYVLARMLGMRHDLVRDYLSKGRKLVRKGIRFITIEVD